MVSKINKDDLKEQFSRTMSEDKKTRKSRSGVKTVTVNDESLENLRVVKEYLGGTSDSSTFIFCLKMVAKAVSEGRLDL